METGTIRGVVSSGQGKAGGFVEIPWAKYQLERRLGFTPYPGTLNIRLSDRESTRLNQILAKTPGVDIDPQKGFYRARCFPVTIMGRVNGAIIIPQTPDYPSNVVEIVAAVCLRELLSLKDGDSVEVTVKSGVGSTA
jgi:riboflavin kinase